MKGLYRIHSIILCFVGVGALFGGMLGITDPYGVSFGMSTELLRRGPFTSFLIPGLFLFIVIGLGHLAAFVFVKRRMKLHPYISGAAGCILMAWIMIQCYMLQAINILHVIFFMIGLAESGISLYMLVKLKQFPFS
ncbi:hypothetical protein [Lutispora saccharofermentans]|uniref:Uncharacterized protein n=1 Tax=Lutispora saccharofermentans TaxID=3024236 RepID=A0ABT1NIV3_9FIRM|nr:hypothetical protein [Lutispora saccharofermentans]MCQ1531200.1 hypothetical protein [Lutispora saccharofermentans]